MPIRRLRNRYHDRSVLLRALYGCEAGEFAHLSVLEQANVERNLRKRLADIDAEITEMEAADRS